MRLKFIIPITVFLIIFSFVLACNGSSSKAKETKGYPVESEVEDTYDKENDIAIQYVKDNLTTDIVGSFKAVKYENGYVVNFEDMAYWYVEGGIVYSLNGFAKTYAADTEYKYGIEWEKLF